MSDDIVTLGVGDRVRVTWSNGAGHSVYLLMDDEGDGPHRLVELYRKEHGETQKIWHCINTHSRTHWFVHEDGGASAVLTRAEAGVDHERHRRQGLNVITLERPEWDPRMTDKEYVALLVQWLRVVPYDHDKRDDLRIFTGKPVDGVRRAMTAEERAIVRLEFGMEVTSG